MNRFVTAVALAAMAATAAAQSGDKPDRQDIVVTVVGGKTTVAENVARTTNAHGALVWSVQAGYRFSDEGIVFERSAARHYDCKIVGNGQRFRCRKNDHASNELHKYDVNLINDQTGAALDRLDPYIQND